MLKIDSGGTDVVYKGDGTQEKYETGAIMLCTLVSFDLDHISDIPKCRE